MMPGASADGARSAASGVAGAPAGATAAGIPRKPTHRLFYGWVIVAIGLLIQAVGAGNAYLTGAYMVPFKEAFHSSTENLVMATTGVMMLAYGLLSPLYGILVRRIDLRYFATAVFAAMAFGYIGLAYATALWQAAVIYSVFFSIGYLGYLVAPTLVANWFIVKRGFAFGIVGCGFAVPGFFLVPIMTYAIRHYGLGTSFLVYGLLLACFIPLALFCVASRPEDKGLHPDGAGSAPDDSADAASQNPKQAWTVPKLLRSRRFWIVAVIVNIQPTVVQQIMLHLMPMAKAASIDLQAASFLLSTQAIMALVGKISVGWISDRLGTRVIALLPMIGISLCCALLLASSSYGGFLAASAVLGFASGAGVVMIGLVIARTFHRTAFGLVAGLTVPLCVALSLLATWATGRAIDVTGGYGLPIKGFIVLLVVGGLLALTFPRRLSVC